MGTVTYYFIQQRMNAWYWDMEIIGDCGAVEKPDTLA